jgi:hypothetical protein
VHVDADINAIINAMRCLIEDVCRKNVGAIPASMKRDLSVSLTHTNKDYQPRAIVPFFHTER